MPSASYRALQPDVTTCRSCRAPVFFVRCLSTGKNLICDAAPAADGNTVLIDHRTAKVLGPDALDGSGTTSHRCRAFPSPWFVLLGLDHTEVPPHLRHDQGVGDGSPVGHGHVPTRASPRAPTRPTGRRSERLREHDLDDVVVTGRERRKGGGVGFQRVAQVEARSISPEGGTSYRHVVLWVDGWPWATDPPKRAERT